MSDLRAAVAKDPATQSARSALLHQGVHGMWLHRLAQVCERSGASIAARLIAYVNRVITGIDISPSATVGDRVFIDHGAGVVIGATAIVEDDVMMYHNVTIGSVGWWRDAAEDGRRHPRVGSSTVLCTGVVLLGPITVGRGCFIGARAVILSDVPDGTRIPAGAVWRSRPVPSAGAHDPEVYMEEKK